MLGDRLPAERGRAGRQQVQLSERERVHPDRLGDELHVPLEPPEELDVAEAAVGGAVGLVGVDRVGVHPGVRDVVRSRCRVARRPGDVDGVVGVGAGVPVHRHLLGRDLSVGAHPGLDAVGEGAATRQQAELLLPGRLQAHRPSPGLAREAGEQRLEVDARLSAETAADMGNHHPDLVQGQPQGGAEEVADRERRLRARPDGHLVAGLPLDDRDVGLEGDVLDGGVGVLAFDDPVRGREPRVHVTLAHPGDVRDVGAWLRAEGCLHVGIAAEVRVHQRRVPLDRLHRVEDRGEDLVLDVDQVDRRAGDVRSLGSHRCDRLTEMAHHVLGQDVLVDDVEAEAVVELMPGEHRVDAAERLGPRGVDADDPGPSVRALLDLGVEHAGQHEVAGVDGVARELSGDLDPLVTDADRTLRHSAAPPSRLRPAARMHRAPPRRSAGSPCSGRSCPRYPP